MKKLDQLISFFNDHGYQAYGVGGCVRNYLLGLKIHDFDVATDATPLEMLSLFKDFKTSTVGQKYGTIGVYFDGLFFECTTYRSDSLKSDFRRPETVTYESSLYKDLKRRDFTMNGLAYKQGELIDVVNGESDINHRLIRAVGNPKVRFMEDALRMLRALRFVSELGFEIERETLLAMH